MITATAEQVFEQYGDMILRFTVARSGNRYDGEDLLQEVFVRYIRSAPEFESEEHRKAWLLRTAVNCSNSLASSAWKKRNLPLEEGSLPMEEYGEEAVLPEENEVCRAVQSLPLKYRTVIHLFYYEEMPTKEIASVMGCADATVRSLLRRSRKKLERILKGVEL